MNDNDYESDTTTILNRYNVTSSTATGTIENKENHGNQFIQRIKRWDFILIYGSILIVSILFISVAFFGSETEWYKNLNKPPLNSWIIRLLWIVASILSYVGLFLLWENVKPDEVSRDLAVSVFFMIGTFISLSWAVAFYGAQNLGIAVWLAFILFIYKFWVFIYIWYIKPLAAIFLIPILLMNVYLLYSTIHIASSNNVPL